MGLNNSKKVLDVDLKVAFNVLYERGLTEGYDLGYDHGFADGKRSEMENHNPAISDGLRAGSSECGKQMSRRRVD